MITTSWFVLLGFTVIYFLPIISVVVVAVVVPASTNLNRTGKRASLHKRKCTSHRLDVAFDSKSKQSGNGHELSPYKTIFSEKCNCTVNKYIHITKEIILS
jgi:hypothetical protein